MRQRSIKMKKTYFDINEMFKTVANNLDLMFFLLLVESLELPFLLPRVQRPNNDL